jgi:hypothetical protein
MLQGIPGGISLLKTGIITKGVPFKTAIKWNQN